jgi:hypothetical protein
MAWLTRLGWIFFMTRQTPPKSLTRAIPRFSAAFGGIEIRPARRAKENSPAIHRWGTVAAGKVPQGRQDALARTRGSKEAFLSSLRDFLRLGRLPSDESLGYFRSSLWDFSQGSNCFWLLRGWRRPQSISSKAPRNPLSRVAELNRWRWCVNSV